MFSPHVFYLFQFWWILLGYIKAPFWPVLAATLFGQVWIRKDYIGISLVVFPCKFSRHIITCHIPVSFWVSFMYVSLLTTISCYACLIGQ